METLLDLIFGDGFFQSNMALWIGYFPLGIIGVWRWSVWCFKKGISFFYRLPKGRYYGTVSLVVPVYNEDPKMFRKALSSWKKNGLQEIIAIIDYTDTACIEVFKSFKKSCPEAKMIVTHIQGKRAALAEGINVSTSEIVALADSDTIWTSGFKKKIIGPFQDGRVGGVAPRQDVLYADTLAKKLFRIHIFNRYGNDLVYQAAFGNALSCISGRTGVYRRSAIAHLTDELTNERFLGKKCISGDDKRLTSLIQRDGWDVKYVENALVYTPGSVDMKTYTKQQIRWTRNSWRSDLKSIFTRWLWRHPFLAFHTLDRFVQPFTLLLGMMFLIVALNRGDWLIAGILVCWWLVSRAVKIFGHLIKHPSDISILPTYIAYCYLLAIIKIYTLLTVDDQVWITRWDKSRMRDEGFFKNSSAYAATFSIVALIFFVSYETNDHLSRAAIKEEKAILAQQKAEKKLFKLEDQSQFVYADDRLAQSWMEILSRKVNQDAFGYYRIQWGESLADVKKRFLLQPDAVLFTENKVALSDSSRVYPGERIAIPINDLRNPAMMLYRQQSTSGFIAMNYFKQNAIRVTGKGSFVTIPELTRRINNKAIIEDLGNKHFVVKKNIFIDNGVTLIIDGADVTWLKMKSDPKGFVWLKSENGNIVIHNTKITSWNGDIGYYDMDINDGRSYIVQKFSGRMDISNSELSYLGYYGSPKRGNPFGGPYGVSWKIANGSFRNDLSTGTILRSKIHNNLFGVYTYGATGLLIDENEVFDNIQYGIDPHDDSNHFLISNNNVYRNGGHGIIASKRCFSNIIRGNHSTDNHLHGIMLDRESNNNLIEGNYISGNTDGIVLYHSFENILLHNSLNNNKSGIRMNNESKDNFFGENIVDNNQKGFYAYQNSVDNYIFRNTFLHNKIHVHLKQNSSSFFAKVLKNEVFQEKQASVSDFFNKVF